MFVYILRHLFTYKRIKLDLFTLRNRQWQGAPLYFYKWRHCRSRNNWPRRHICLNHVTVTSLPAANPEPIYLAKYISTSFQFMNTIKILKNCSQCTVIEEENKINWTSMKVNSTYVSYLNVISDQNIRLETRVSCQYSYTLLVKIRSCICYSWCVLERKWWITWQTAVIVWIVKWNQFEPHK